MQPKGLDSGGTAEQDVAAEQRMSDMQPGSPFVQVVRNVAILVLLLCLVQSLTTFVEGHVFRC